jgi:general secretion pathway protein C
MYRIAVFLNGLAMWAALPSSQLPLALVGVAVNAATPSQSVSMIRCAYPAATSAAAMFRAGQRACDVAEVVNIQSDAVVIRNLVTRRLERLPLHNVGTAPLAAAAMASAPPAPTIVKRSPAGVTVDVPKATVTHYLVNLTELLTAALATPHFQETGNGQRGMDGFQLGEIRPGSVVEQLGLQNGDVITAANGEKLDSMAAVIRLAGQAQNMGRATMLILRAGTPMTFVFNTK